MPKKIVAKKKKATTKKKLKKPGKKVAKKNKPIGKVTHFYAHIKVAIVKFNTKVKIGTELYFKGATTDFKEAPKSMQYNHVAISSAPKGKQIGIKLKKRVREGDLVYKA
jgi:hypothetical protein